MSRDNLGAGILLKSGTAFIAVSLLLTGCSIPSGPPSSSPEPLSAIEEAEAELVEIEDNTNYLPGNVLKQELLEVSP